MCDFAVIQKYWKSIHQIEKLKIFTVSEQGAFSNQNIVTVKYTFSNIRAVKEMHLIDF